MFDGDRTLFAGFPDAAFQFLAVVGFAGLVFFYYDKVGVFGAFEGGEAEIALVAGAAAADFTLFVGVAGI